MSRDEKEKKAASHVFSPLSSSSELCFSFSWHFDRYVTFLLFRRENDWKFRLERARARTAAKDEIRRSQIGGARERGSLAWNCINLTLSGGYGDL